MKIRKATKKDIPAIVRMMNSSENLAGSKEIVEIWNKLDILDFLSHRLYQIFVCEIDKKVVGVSIIEFHKIVNRSYIYYYVLVIDSAYRGKGIGSKMMDYIENLAKKNRVKLIWALAEENNKVMKKIFAKRGYKKGKKFIYFSMELK